MALRVYSCKRSAGKFIVATNELDSKKLSDEEALTAYKEQQYAESGFRFLKDPLFFADSMFLKNEGGQDSCDGDGTCARGL